MGPRKVCPNCGAFFDLALNFCPADGTILRLEGGTLELVGQIVGGRYRVLEKLGEGGMGQVYLAEHVRMSRRCAVKIMHPALAKDTEAVGRFNREAANAGRINHPNVADVYDFGETEDGLVYLAMEHVKGEALSRILDRDGALPVLRAVEIARQVADALSAAHELGIVHRDLKPDNVILARSRDGRDTVKVIDFGIAKAMQGAGQNLTRTGFVIGTVEYMSPEQLVGDALDGRSDIYSLGCVLYEMLTGERTFAGPSGAAAITQRLTQPPPHPREKNPEIPEALDEAVVRALGRTAAERFASASELSDTLAAFLPITGSRELPAIALPTGFAAAPTPTPATPAEAVPAPTHVATPATPAASVPVSEPPRAPTPADAIPAAPAEPATRTPTPQPALAWEPVSEPLAAFEQTPAGEDEPPTYDVSPPPVPAAPRKFPRPALLAAAMVGVIALGGALTLASKDRSSDAEAVAAPQAPTVEPGQEPGYGLPATAEPLTQAESPSQPEPASTAAESRPTPATETRPAAPAAPRTGQLRIAGSLPAGATVLVDGTPTSQRSLTLAAGRHQVVVSAPGYDTVRWSPLLGAGDVETWTPRLNRLPEPERPQPAPERAAPAPETPRTPDPVPERPAPQPPASGGPRQPNAAELRSAVEPFVTAINSRDFNQLRRAWPGIGGEELRGWREFLGSREITDISARIDRFGAADVSEGLAEVNFSVLLTFNSGGRQTQRPTFRAVYNWDSGGWRLVGIRPTS